MTTEERAFYKLMAKLASDGLFNGRPEAAAEIVIAFEKALTGMRSLAPDATSRLPTGSRGSQVSVHQNRKLKNWVMGEAMDAD